MNIEELTPKYILNKIEKGFERRSVDLSVENMDIKLILKKGKDYSFGISSVYLVERVSDDPKVVWNDILYANRKEKDFMGFHPYHFYILNYGFAEYESICGWNPRHFVGLKTNGKFTRGKKQRLLEFSQLICVLINKRFREKCGNNKEFDPFKSGCKFIRSLNQFSVLIPDQGGTK